MLAQSRRRWANNESTLVQCLVFAGKACGGKNIDYYFVFKSDIGTCVISRVNQVSKRAINIPIINNYQIHQINLFMSIYKK